MLEQLLEAIRETDYNKVVSLVANGADVNGENSNCEKPLTEACRMNDLLIIRYLVEHGADINSVSRKCDDFSNSLTYLFYGIDNEIEFSFTSLKFLVENGANVNPIPDEGEGGIPLLIACGYKELFPSVTYLVEHGADVNKKNIDFYTPLIIAVEIMYLPLIEYLVDHGANLDTKDSDGKTLLEKAERQYNMAVESLQRFRSQDNQNIVDENVSVIEYLKRKIAEKKIKNIKNIKRKQSDPDPEDEQRRKRNTSDISDLFDRMDVSNFGKRRKITLKQLNKMIKYLNLI